MIKNMYISPIRVCSSLRLHKKGLPQLRVTVFPLRYESLSALTLVGNGSIPILRLTWSACI